MLNVFHIHFCIWHIVKNATQNITQWLKNEVKDKYYVPRGI